MRKLLSGFVISIVCGSIYAATNMNAVTQQDLNAVQTTTTQHNIDYTPKNEVMDPNSPPPAAEQPVNTVNTTNASVSDNQIMTLIQSQVTEDKNLGGTNIRVTCHQGVVTLEGDVNSLAQASEAQAIANSVRGVKHVMSTLKVRGNSNPPGNSP
jgi:hypothetical protein